MQKLEGWPRCSPGVGTALATAQSVVSFAAASENYNNAAENLRQNYAPSLTTGGDEQRQLSLRMIQEGVAFADKQQAGNIGEASQAVVDVEASGKSAGVSDRQRGTNARITNRINSLSKPTAPDPLGCVL